jgi:histidine triad (HIT) family protein
MCLFCEIAAGRTPAHRVHEDDRVLAFLDIRPLFVGHVLVTPQAHYETLVALPHDLVEPFFLSVQRIARAVEIAMEAGGTFVAINNKVSQSVPHLHAHVVPRRPKDGLKGFFWPRQKYRDEEHLASTAAAIRDALAAG